MPSEETARGNRAIAPKKTALEKTVEDWIKELLRLAKAVKEETPNGAMGVFLMKKNSPK